MQNKRQNWIEEQCTPLQAYGSKALSLGKDEGGSSSALPEAGGQGPSSRAGRAGASQTQGAKCKETLVTACAGTRPTRSASFDSVPWVLACPTLVSALDPSPPLPQYRSFWKDGFGGHLPPLTAD